MFWITVIFQFFCVIHIHGHQNLNEMFNCIMKCNCKLWRRQMFISILTVLKYSAYSTGYSVKSRFTWKSDPTQIHTFTWQAHPFQSRPAQIVWYYRVVWNNIHDRKVSILHHHTLLCHYWRWAAMVVWVLPSWVVLQSIALRYAMACTPKLG